MQRIEVIHPDSSSPCENRIGRENPGFVKHRLDVVLTHR